MLELFAGSAAYPSPSPRPVLTVGNFDGVHQGHLHLLEQAISEARAKGVPACVYTFEPTPRAVMSSGGGRTRIMGWPDKFRFLGEVGIDQVIIEQFTPAFSMHPAEWFVDQILLSRIQPSAMVVGYDFRFGRKRLGTVEVLRDRMPDCPIFQVSGREHAGTVISSSRIRALLEVGAVGKASALLGRPHFLRGTVVEGDQRGRTIGYPTANIVPSSGMMPGSGVYVVWVSVDRGPRLAGVGNLGQRPTFDGRGLLLEVHVLDHEQDLYGRELEVEFVERIRGEIRFEGPTELVAQINRDVLRARAILAGE